MTTTESATGNRGVQEDEVTYYDKDGVFEFYWNCDRPMFELFQAMDPANPKSVRVLADKLLKDIGPTDDQIPPRASELALLLAANAHAYARDFCRPYSEEDAPLSFEERECVAKGWRLKAE